jgi:hypothetical protein
MLLSKVKRLKQVWLFLKVAEAISRAKRSKSSQRGSHSCARSGDRVQEFTSGIAHLICSCEIVAFARENSLALVVGEKTAGRLLSAISAKVGRGYRLAFPTGRTTHGKAQFSKALRSSQTEALHSIGAKLVAATTPN